MLVLMPIAFGLLGALFVDSLESSDESFGLITSKSPPDKSPVSGPRTRFGPVKRRRARIRSFRSRRGLAQGLGRNEPSDDSESLLSGEEPQTEAADPYTLAVQEIELEETLNGISAEIASDMFGSDNFGGKRAGSKIGWNRRGQQRHRL